MSQAISVKVSSRYQIAMPQAARKRLNIQSGDRLLVDIQDGMIVLIPTPKNYASKLAGLHRELWQNLDSSVYIREERDAWDNSAKS
jgi:AbrB family looped-hinge helix DNA binding protein